MPDPDFHDGELVRWLQEAGRRRVVRRPNPEQLIGAPAAPAPAPAPMARRAPGHRRHLILIALAALAYLPYFFADVHLQIASLPHVIVFV